MLGTIPKELLSKIKKASEDDSALFPKSDIRYLNLLSSHGYIRIVDVTDFDTPDNCVEYHIELLSTLE